MATPGIEITVGDPAKLFKIVTKLGEGSYGSVYSAVDLRDGTEVAIKVLEVDQADLSELQKEVNILRTCSNPFIVGYRGCWEKGRNVWIVMEFCAGGSLGDLLLLCNIILTEVQCRAVLYMTLHGLVYLHQRKLIHRDIKAANILLTRDGVCKLGDFGVSAELTSTMAKRKTAVGTPYWMAPEMLASSEYDSKADLWSLAITAIELCAGEPPHANQHPMRVLFLIPSSPPPTLPEAHRYSLEFNEFLSQSLQMDPALRPDAANLLKHVWFRGMSIPSAQNIVRALVISSLAEIESCREQEAQENDWNADNIIATSNEAAGIGNGANATFKPDMLQDGMSYYPEDDNGGGTMVIAPSMKADIQSQFAQNDDADYGGTTVLHPDFVSNMRAQNAQTQSVVAPINTAQNNRPAVMAVNSPAPTPIATTGFMNKPPGHAPMNQQPLPPQAGASGARSPQLTRLGSNTLMVTESQYQELLLRDSSNNLLKAPSSPLPSLPPNGTRSNPPAQLPIPAPPTTTSQYHQRGAQTPHAGSSQNAASANASFPQHSRTNGPVGTAPTPPRTAPNTAVGGQRVAPAGPNSVGITAAAPAPAQTVPVAPLPVLSISSSPPLEAAGRSVQDMLQQLRAQSAGDIAQMMKSLEERRKHDQDVLNAFYALAKKELISSSR